MPIKIILPTRYIKYGESLEILEDKIRNLLLSQGFKGFTIEDSYTGNTTKPHGGEN